MGSYKRNMDMDIALVDPADMWHGMLVIYCPIGFGGAYKWQHEHRYMQYGRDVITRIGEVT